MILDKHLTDKYLRHSNLEVLVKKLVPSKFYNQKDGIIVNVVRAFIYDIQTQLGDLDDNMYRFVSIKELNDYDILRIYHQTYLATLGIDKQDDFVVLSSSKLFSYINELVQYKGSAFLMVLLSNLLSTLIPSVRSAVKVIEDQLNDPNISGQDKLLLNAKLHTLLDLFTKSSIIEVEEVDLFSYKVVGELDFISWYKFIKPFTHMLGWSVEFINNTITVYFDDQIDIYEMVVIDEMIKWETHPNITMRRYKSLPLNHYPHSFLLANTNPRFIITDPNDGYVYNYNERYIGNIKTDQHDVGYLWESSRIEKDDIRVLRYEGDDYDDFRPRIRANHDTSLTSDKAHASQDDTFLYKRVILRDKRIFNDIE